MGPVEKKFHLIYLFKFWFLKLTILNSLSAFLIFAKSILLIKVKSQTISTAVFLIFCENF